LQLWHENQDEEKQTQPDRQNEQDYGEGTGQPSVLHVIDQRIQNVSDKKAHTKQHHNIPRQVQKSDNNYCCQPPAHPT
jgi:hypothetical protein